MQKQKVLFLLKFLLTLIVAYAIVAWNPVNDRVIVPFTAALAATATAVLQTFGEQVTVNGTLLSSSRFGVQVNNGCNGVEAMLILLAAIVAFPASIRARAVGLLTGIVVVQVLNQVRIISLYLLGAYRPRLFDVFHTAVWQIVVIGAAMVVFVVWTTRVAPHRTTSRA